MHIFHEKKYIFSKNRIATSFFLYLVSHHVLKWRQSYHKSTYTSFYKIHSNQSSDDTLL